MPRKKGSKNKIVVTTANVDAVVRKMEKEIAKDHIYKATLKSVGRIFKAEGMTFEDALRGIKISNGARAMSVLTVGNVGKETIKVLDPDTSQRLFGVGSPTTRDYHLNKIRQRFGV